MAPMPLDEAVSKLICSRLERLRDAAEFVCLRSRAPATCPLDNPRTHAGTHAVACAALDNPRPEKNSYKGLHCHWQRLHAMHGRLYKLCTCSLACQVALRHAHAHNRLPTHPPAHRDTIRHSTCITPDVDTRAWYRARAHALHFQSRFYRGCRAW